jgi:hypothetical protein
MCPKGFTDRIGPQFASEDDDDEELSSNGVPSLSTAAMVKMCSELETASLESVVANPLVLVQALR